MAMGSELFEGVHYYIIENSVKGPVEVGELDSLAAQVKRVIVFSQIKQTLREAGASREFYMSDLVTHVISDSTPIDPEIVLSKNHVTVHVRVM